MFSQRNARLSVAQKNQTLQKIWRPGYPVSEEKYHARLDAASHLDEIIEASEWESTEENKKPLERPNRGNVDKRTVTVEIPVWDEAGNLADTQVWEVTLTVPQDKRTGRKTVYDLLLREKKKDTHSARTFLQMQETANDRASFQETIAENLELVKPQRTFPANGGGRQLLTARQEENKKPLERPNRGDVDKRTVTVEIPVWDEAGKLADTQVWDVTLVVPQDKRTGQKTAYDLLMKGKNKDAHSVFALQQKHGAEFDRASFKGTIAENLELVKPQRTLPDKEADNGEKFSLKSSSNGIEVYETSDEVKLLPYKQRMEQFLNIMQKQYRGRTAKFKKNGIVQYAKFDDADIRKNIYGDKKSSRKGWKAKINVGADGDIFELVENAKYKGSAEEQGKETASHRNVSSWDYYVKTVQIDGQMYDLLANVRKKPDGEYCYSIQLNEHKKKAAAPPLAPAYDSRKGTDYAQNGVPTDASNSSIYQDTKKGKKLSLKDGGELKHLRSERKEVRDLAQRAKK